MDWSEGSSLFFWRWHLDLRMIACRGIKPYIIFPMPISYKPAKFLKENVQLKLLQKFVKFIKRGYFTFPNPKTIKNFIDYFFVPKGDDNIRPVFNGTSCGLTSALWSPSFWLPTASTLIRATTFNSKFVDLDFGEMFHNFPLHESVIPYSGVDLSPFRKDLDKLGYTNGLKGPKLVATWSITWMGLKTSPEHCVWCYYFLEEFVSGSHREVNNPLRWDRIILNIFGNPDFNPLLPFLMKWDDINNRIAGELLAYVDDLRGVGISTNHAWEIARWVATRIQYLGSQDASRKRRVDQGPWAGSIVITSEDSVCKTVQKTKWEKAKTYLSELNDRVQEGPRAQFSYKRLEQMRGFFCHLGMTFDILMPYLKGFHLSLSSHNPQRNEEGWRLEPDEWIVYVHNQVEMRRWTNEEAEEYLQKGYSSVPPTQITAVPMFFKCSASLNCFFDSDDPPLITARSKVFHLVFYGFVDASKQGFGSLIEGDQGVFYRVGTWGADSEANSSNWCEFTKLVDTLEEEASSGKLDKSTIVMETDNTTVEGCYHKGNSTSPLLYDLILKLKRLEFHRGLKLYITHVSGERMKQQGADGLSRGHFKDGVCSGGLMLTYCPWGQFACQRSPPLIQWLKSWIPGHSPKFLKPDDWFTKGHDLHSVQHDNHGYWSWNVSPATYVWDLPPVIANIRIEELRKARNKRQESSHVIVVPKLFTHMWKKQLLKCCDLVFDITANKPYWSCYQFESLTIGFCFPFLQHKPWQLRRTPKLCSIERNLSKVFKGNSVDGGSVLLQLWLEVQSWNTMPEGVVWKVLYFGKRNYVPSQRPSSQTDRPVKRRKQR